MRKSIIYIIIIAFFGSCSNYTKDEINDFLFEESFLFINKKQDTVQIEFLDNCVKTYSWNYRIYEEWKISEHESEIILYFEGGNYELKSKIENEIIFTNNKINFRLIKVTQNKIRPENLKGIWIEDKYSHLLIDTILHPPPCPNFEVDTFLIPCVEFNEDSAIINDFCFKQKWVYKTNLKFGFISFGEYCTSPNQWKIIELTKDTMIVNARYRKNGEIKYEENKTYIKYGS
jgi:hypothetical protein